MSYANTAGSTSPHSRGAWIEMSKVYNAILLAVEMIEARERVTDLMEELT